MAEARIMSNGKLRIDHISGKSIKFRHFSGDRDKYHAQGARDFNIEISDEFAEELIVNGWRVKAGKDVLDPETGENKHYGPMLKVIVKYHDNGNGTSRGPLITRYTSGGSVDIDESFVKDIDLDQIDDACFILSPYLSKDYDGKYTPYLERMVYKVEEDPYHDMY